MRHMMYKSALDWGEIVSPGIQMWQLDSIFLTEKLTVNMKLQVIL